THHNPRKQASYAHKHTTSSNSLSHSQQEDWRMGLCLFSLLQMVYIQDSIITMSGRPWLARVDKTEFSYFYSLALHMLQAQGIPFPTPHRHYTCCKLGGHIYNKIQAFSLVLKIPKMKL